MVANPLEKVIVPIPPGLAPAMVEEHPAVHPPLAVRGAAVHDDPIERLPRDKERIQDFQRRRVREGLVILLPHGS